MRIVHFERGRFEALCKPHLYDNMTRVTEWVTCGRCLMVLERMRRESVEPIARRKVISRGGTNATGHADTETRFKKTRSVQS